MHATMHSLKRMGKGFAEIAVMFGCGEVSVRNYLRKPIGWLPKCFQAAQTVDETVREHDGDAITGGLQNTPATAPMSTGLEQKNKKGQTPTSEPATAPLAS